MDLNWINEFLPTCRCPHTQQPLRWADEQDRSRHQLPTDVQALVSQDGSRLYPIDQGIPVLLPQEQAAGSPQA